MKKIFSILLVTIMIFSATPAFAASSDIDSTDVILDAIFLRPLGLASTAFGSVFFVATLPISAITGSVGTTYEVLVEDPFVYTFRRPLGQIKKND